MGTKYEVILHNVPREIEEKVSFKDDLVAEVKKLTFNYHCDTEREEPEIILGFAEEPSDDTSLHIICIKDINVYGKNFDEIEYDLMSDIAESLSDLVEKHGSLTRKRKKAKASKIK